ncbi:response regulator [Nafulsella turpanensis]|uniref:response regulator n=1 Tax=Nafulsella turpanensis TaxID=1265690 RepID=UPI0003481ED2|nr:response regulator transcription factor [Nafulsella turpanensis]
MEKIKILVVDDHNLVRDGIITMLTSCADFEVVGEASDGEEAINKSYLIQPDIILMDIILPGINGIEASRIIRGKLPKIKIMFLSMEVSQEYLNEIIKIGAEGYVLKDIRKNELAGAVRNAVSGTPYFSKSISDLVFRKYYEQNSLEGRGEKAATPAKLTERELEIVKLLSLGISKKEIADQLFISPRTVDAHRSHILEKLELKGTVELVKYAIKHQIIEI